MYTLERQMLVQTSLATAWDFLKDPANLNTITPPDLHFRILSELPEAMFDGLLIEYRIAIPLFGERAWTAEIKHIREGRSFVDEQRLGPFSFWYHYHELEEAGDKVQIIDRVHFRLPFGPIGTLMHGLYVKRTLERIFDYRRERLKALFNGCAGQ
jgi:ligand-binding SRPBCC domain-containing protein